MWYGTRITLSLNSGMDSCLYGRDRIVVSTSRCGRDNPGSNPGHGRAQLCVSVMACRLHFCLLLSKMRKGNKFYHVKTLKINWIVLIFVKYSYYDDIWRSHSNAIIFGMRQKHETLQIDHWEHAGNWKHCQQTIHKSESWKSSQWTKNYDIGNSFNKNITWT